MQRLFLRVAHFAKNTVSDLHFDIYLALVRPSDPVDSCAYDKQCLCSAYKPTSCNGADAVCDSIHCGHHFDGQGARDGYVGACTASVTD